MYMYMYMYIYVYVYLYGEKKGKRERVSEWASECVVWEGGEGVSTSASGSAGLDGIPLLEGPAVTVGGDFALAGPNRTQTQQEK